MEALMRNRPTEHIEKSQFFEDVVNGLQSQPKHLQSKYFYDDEGDRLFQEIMNCGEYYLTNCEMEIFSEQASALDEVLMDDIPFDLIELGAGDATKSTHLLRELIARQADFTYMPIDISSHIISHLNATLPLTLPGLKIKGLNGEYFQMMEKAAKLSDRRKVVLFMGSNIGNMPPADAQAFLTTMRKHLSPGDMAIVGYDLKKEPRTILAAYDDSEGITKRFNLNLLTRINRELNADFDVKQFNHYASYDPETGACKSYLISLAQQDVHIPDGPIVHFAKNEYIYMEISQKYDREQMDQFAGKAGFKPITDFTDSKGWFVDAVWEAK
jgi:L-histidine Nalpha-methyltransferase